MELLSDDTIFQNYKNFLVNDTKALKIRDNISFFLIQKLKILGAS